MCRLFLRSFRSGSPACNGIQPRSCIPHLNVGSSHRRLEVQEADRYCEHDFTFQSDSAAVLEALSRGTERFSRFFLLATQRKKEHSCAEHPSNRRCHCRNTCSPSGSKGIGTASFMGVENLPTRTRRTRVWGCIPI